MKYRIFIFSISLILCFQSLQISAVELAKQSYENNNYEMELTDFIESINTSLVKYYLEKLVSFGPRPTGSDNCSKVAEYIYNEFYKMNLDVYFDEWSFPLVQNKNIIATLNGKSENQNGMYIICAHYDTWWNSSGANDDGSGVAVILSIANILSNYCFHNTIRFVLFSGHETGPLYTYGSFAYVKQAYQNNDNILGVINIDAVGSTGDSGNALRVSKSTRSDQFSKITESVAERYYQLINIKIQITEFDNIALDHQSFIDYGYEAITYIQPNGLSVPCHCPEDNLDSIDFNFLTNVTKLTIAVVVTLAEKPNDLQVNIVKPKEGIVYLRDQPIIDTFGLNLRYLGIRGLTYLIGGITAEINIITHEEIFYDYFYIDNQISINGIKTGPPYDFSINLFSIKPFLSCGKHKLSVIVTTTSGKIAYDEMDIFII